MPAPGVLLPSYEKGRWLLRGRLAMNAGTAYAFGRWGRLACARPFTLTIVSLGPSALISPVQIYVANSDDKPPDITSPTVLGAAQLGQNITSPQTLEYDLPYEWIAAVIVGGSGNSTAVDLRSAERG